MILIVGQNAAWQKVCVLSSLKVGEVNRVERVTAFPSSKGVNAARALACMGREAAVLCYAGGGTGDMFLRALRQEGIETDATPIAAETRVCVTCAEPGGHSTELIEPSPRIDAAESGAFRRRFLERIDAADVLALMGTMVAGEDQDRYRWFTEEARRRGVIVIMDAAGDQARRALEANPEVLKINQAELAELTGRSVDTAERRKEAYGELVRKYGVRWIFISRGASGMEGFDGRRLLFAAPPPVRVVNAIGSGDAACAGIAWRLSEAKRLPGGPRDGGRVSSPFDSPILFEETLRTAVAMGTANCLNEINGRILPEDFRKVREGIVITE
jgi:tagatose 6-phosphate kinase